MKGLVAMSLLGIGAAKASDIYNEPPSSISIAQEGWCVPVNPIYTGQTIEEFLNYRRGCENFDCRIGSARPSLPITQPNGSVIFLFQEPSGHLCLVLMHDHTAIESGATQRTVWFRFKGLPKSGKWVVRDDKEDFEHMWSEPPHSVRWRWTAGETDGGAFCYLGSSFDITARIADFGYLDNWSFLSGESDYIGVVPLDPDRYLRVHTGECPPDEVDKKYKEKIPVSPPADPKDPETPEQTPPDDYPTETPDEPPDDHPTATPEDPPDDHPPDKHPPDKHPPDKHPKTPDKHGRGHGAHGGPPGQTGAEPGGHGKGLGYHGGPPGQNEDQGLLGRWRELWPWSD